MKYKYSQLAIVEFDNCAPFLHKIVSNKKITIDKFASFMKKAEGFDEGRDSITFVDEPSAVKI